MIYRIFKRIRLNVFKFFSSREVFKRPNNLTTQEETVCTIFINLLLEPNSKLFYDIETMQCFLINEKETLFLFLEPNNIKVINTIFGYDVNISTKLEQYLLYKFKKEMTKRRQTLKQKALAKVTQSLDTTLKDLKTKSNISTNNIETKNSTTFGYTAIKEAYNSSLDVGDGFNK